MDLNAHSQNENIRKIEDIIDIQKANGNFNVKQVAFTMPLEKDGAVPANIAKSLESGLTKSKYDGGTKKVKKLRQKRGKSPLPDAISWPSDSDITVLKMRVCLKSSDLNEKLGNALRGDGVHQSDSSSMVNLATLMRQSQPPSKQNLNEEYLLPLSSWERCKDQPESKTAVENRETTDIPVQFMRNFNVYDAVCSRVSEFDSIHSNMNDISEKFNRKSKLARFLRLYFCPCCKCLYKMEKIRDQPSEYFTRNND